MLHKIGAELACIHHLEYIFPFRSKPDDIQVINYIEMKDSIHGIDPVSEKKGVFGVKQ